MNNPMDLIRAGHPIREVMPIVASMEPNAFHDHFANLDDNDVMLLGAWGFDKLNATGVEWTVTNGFVLSMYNVATATESREQLFEKMLDELGLSQTQAYRSMAVWRRAGRLLLETPGLANRFVVEGLKILCSDSSPDEALLAAFDAAKRGERIDIEAANRFKSRFSEPKVNQAPERKPKQSVSVQRQEIEPADQDKRVFMGRMVSIILRPVAKPENVDLQAAIDDLLAFVGELQSELLGTESAEAMSGKDLQHV